MLYSFSARDTRTNTAREGLMTATGKVVVKPRYSTTGSAGGEFSYATEHNDRIYFDARGKQLFRFSLPTTVAFGSDGIGAMPWWDVGRERVRAAFIEPGGAQRPIDADDVFPLHAGLAVACRDRGSPTLTAASWWDGTSGSYGYVDARGTWKIEPAFSGASAFEGGIAAVAVRAGRGKPKWGAIDARGAWRCKPGFARAVIAGDGLVTVADREQRWGLVDRDGRVVVKPRFAMPLRFSGGLAAAREPGGAAGYLDAAGDWAIAPRFADAGEAIGDVLPVATAGKTRAPKWGLVTRTGDTILAPTHASIARDRALFRYAGTYLRTKPYPWGYLAPTGEVVWSGLR